MAGPTKQMLSGKGIFTRSEMAYTNFREIFRGGVRTSYGEAYGIGDQIGVLLDLEQGHLSFFKNGRHPSYFLLMSRPSHRATGRSMGVAFTDIPLGTPMFPAVGWRDGTHNHQ